MRKQKLIGYNFPYLVLFVVLTLTCTSLCYGDDVDLKLLEEAWKIPTGGSGNKPYNSITIDGHKFLGERHWESRWDLIKDITDYRGMRILEIGCNIALSSIYLQKYREASFCVGVDRPVALLKEIGMPRLYEAAQKIHQAFKVNIDMIPMDLNNSEYETILGSDFDLVVCMSILKWVEDPERFLDYLSQFPKIIYEGHDIDELEIQRFKSRGFQHIILGKTHVGVSYPKNSTRTLIYFFKN